MANFEMTPDTPFSAAMPVEERVTTFLRSVYAWMCGGLAITALTASVIAASPAVVIAVATNRLLFWGLMARWRPTAPRRDDPSRDSDSSFSWASSAWCWPPS